MARLIGDPSSERTPITPTEALSSSDSSFISKKNAERIQEPRRYPVWLTKEEAQYLIEDARHSSNPILKSIALKSKTTLDLKVL